ncbi:MAG TPA: hypothetical protein VJ742_12070 [Nitrososphaera sp.]|nr:hypothetical protein [Nitrososphaera sp.]
MKEMQDSMLNRDGALRKQRDEIHVLYHKISALLGDERKPKNYTKLGDAQKRIALQEILDELEPTDIRFKDPNGRPNTQKWTLVKYGNKPWIDPVSSYPEQALAFC